MLQMFLMTLAVVAVGIVLICIRMILKPGSDFHGTCASRNVNGEKDKGCACGRKPGEACENEGIQPTAGQA